jgi:hypothetical protein
MKKLLFMFVMLVGLTTFGQTQITSAALGNLKSTPTHAVTDTITNAVTKYQLGIVKGYNEIITVQPTFTKISGTAAATVKIQGSVDGVSYNDIGSSYTVTDVAAQSTAFIITPSSYQYYRLSIVPTGTQSVKVVTPVLVRKK